MLTCHNDKAGIDAASLFVCNLLHDLVKKNTQNSSNRSAIFVGLLLRKCFIASAEEIVKSVQQRQHSVQASAV